MTPAGLGLPEWWHAEGSKRIAARDWRGVLGLVASERVPPVIERLWPHLTADEKPGLLAEISGADLPSQCASFLRAALDEILATGRRVFDGDSARDRYSALPAVVPIYRGTVLAEVSAGLTGISWTLDRRRALWFATEHGRFRNTRSPPVIVSAQARKSDIAGVLVERNEDEILINPKRWISKAAARFLREVRP